MALPRSTIAGAVVKTTGQKFTATLLSTPPQNASSVTVTLPSRKFAVGEQIVGWWDTQETGGGLIITPGPVLGNKPNYTCIVSFFNPTGSAIGIATRTFWLAQE